MRTVIWLFRWFAAGLAAAATASGFDQDAAANWPDGTVRLVFNLGDARKYSDGLTPNQVADSARQAWNPYLGRIQLVGQTGATTTPPEDNGANNVFFGANIYGTAFGHNVLAVTIISHTTSRRIETDVVVNSGERWDSYRGWLQNDTTDLRRVLIHEFGHVIGLDHPDEAGQSVDSVMNSHIGFIEDPTRDDQNGAAARYGPGPGSIKPVITEQPRALSVPRGSEAQFYVWLDDNTSVSYQWEKDGRPIPGATHYRYTIPAVSSSDAGDYTVVVTAPTGTVVSNPAKLTVTEPEAPVIRWHPTGSFVVEDQSVTLSVGTDGTPPLKYQWFRNGEPIAGATSSHLRISPAKLSDTGLYWVQVSNAGGSATSETVRVNVVRLPRPRVADVGNVHVEVGSPAGFDVYPWDPSLYQFQWYKDGAAIPGATRRSYSISAVTADDAGEYLVTISNRSGTTTSRAGRLTIHSPAPSASAAWLEAKRLGNIVYFLFESPARIERFDLAAGEFLPALTLPRAPTRMALADPFIYVAFGRTVSRFSLAGTAEEAVFNTESDINELFVAAERLYAVLPGRSNIILYSPETGTATAAPRFPYSLDRGFSYAARLRKVFAVSDDSVFGDIFSADIGAEGTLSGHRISPHPGIYAVGSRTYLFPDEAYVTNDSGTVFRTDDLTYAGAIPQFEDIAFRSDNLFVAIHGFHLTAYDKHRRETGRIRLTRSGLLLFLHGDDAYVFTPATDFSSALQWEKVSLQALIPRESTPVLDPRTIVIRPDALELDKDGNLLMLDRLNRQLHRWSPDSQDFLPSLPLRGAANFFAYSRETHRAYLGYADDSVTELTLADGVESAFTRATEDLIGLTTAGPLPMLIDTRGAWCSYFLYNAEGEHLAWREWSREALHYVWDPVRRRMYQFRDDTSPNDLLYTEISASGSFGEQKDSPYHGEVHARYPIRVSPNGDVVLLGSGSLYSAETLQQSHALANEIDDAVWLNGQLYTVRFGAAGAEVQQWTEADYLLGSSVAFPGYPLRLFGLSENRLLLISVEGSRLMFRILDANLELLSETSNFGDGTSRFSNLSSRARVSTGNDVTIMGFVLGGSSNAQIAVRAVGPTLAAFGVGEALADPRVDVFSDKGERIASNDDWSIDAGTASHLEQAFSASGAFALERGTRDAAVLAGLAPGGYTAVVSGVGSSQGVSLVELYELNVTDASIRLVNVSTRARVGTGDDVLIAGFVVSGTVPRQILVRGIGPGLQQFGVPDALHDPVLSIHDAAKQLVGENDNWAGNDQVRSISSELGAFALETHSRDAAMILTLDPGVYTATVKGANNSTGVALVEVYEVP